jgi:hypothetical protein
LSLDKNQIQEFDKRFRDTGYKIVARPRTGRWLRDFKNSKNTDNCVVAQWQVTKDVMLTTEYRM